MAETEAVRQRRGVHASRPQRGREEHDKLAIGKAPAHGLKMASTASNILFDDIFAINAIDKEGIKFDRGARCCRIARGRGWG